MIGLQNNSALIRLLFENLILPFFDLLQGLERSRLVDAKLANFVDNWMFCRFEQGELEIAALAFWGDMGGVGIDVLRFQLGEDLASPRGYVTGNTGQFGDVNSVALVGRSRYDFVEKDDFVLPFLH